MPDLVRLETELTGRYPEPWVRHHLAAFRAAYFAAFDDGDVSRHLGRVLALTDAQPVSVDVWPEGPGTWRVEAVGYDAFQLLSTLCTLLAIHGLSIVDGLAFTSDPREAPPPSHPATRRWRRPGRPPSPTAPGEPDRRPRIVDRFLVRWAGDDEGEPDWDAFRAELTELARLLRAGRSEEVHHRLISPFVAVMGRYRPEPTALEPIDLAIDPAGEGFATMVRVQTRDSFGFLSLTASALALCGVMIVQADIRTRAGRVEDTFWVTDRFGRRIEDEPRIQELRLALILIEHYSSYLPHATNPEAALVHFSRFAAETMARPDWLEEYDALDRPEVLDALVRVLGESDFLWEDYLHAQPENLLPMVGDPGQWRRGRTPAELAADRDAGLAAARGLDGKAQALPSATASSSARGSGRSSGTAAGRKGSPTICPQSPTPSFKGPTGSRARSWPRSCRGGPGATLSRRRCSRWASAGAASWGSARTWSCCSSTTTAASTRWPGRGSGSTGS
jgi:hypothetical protein